MRGTLAIPRGPMCFDIKVNTSKTPRDLEGPSGPLGFRFLLILRLSDTLGLCSFSGLKNEPKYQPETEQTIFDENSN